MKKFIIIYSLSIACMNLHASDLSEASNSSKSENIRYSKVIKCPYEGSENLINKVVEIKGASKDLFKIDDLWKEYRFALLRYIKSNPPEEGLVYYCDIDGKRYCFHEDWLQDIDQTTDKKTTESISEKE